MKLQPYFIYNLRHSEHLICIENLTILLLYPKKSEYLTQSAYNLQVKSIRTGITCTKVPAIPIYTS